jgi:CheY-like chemotaxis protein
MADAMAADGKVYDLDRIVLSRCDRAKRAGWTSASVRLPSNSDTTWPIISAASRNCGPAGEFVELRLEVSDSGIGIPANVQETLFSPFTQADNSVSRKYGGTGLGLAISRQLSTMMGGAIGVDSVPGQGSTFWFTVHCKRGEIPAVAAPPLAPAMAKPNGKLRILAAEDNPMIRILIAKLLSRRGHLVDLFVNGEEAVAAVQRKAHDLVLMDMHMPKMDRVTATRIIRELSGPERLVPIIALTGNALVGQREICLAAGMNDYLSKPFEAADFYEVIDRCRVTPDHRAGQADGERLTTP